MTFSSNKITKTKPNSTTRLRQLASNWKFQKIQKQKKLKKELKKNQFKNELKMIKKTIIEYN